VVEDVRVLPVCVIGLGLIGGSVLRAARAAGRDVWGYTESGQDAAVARADGFLVESDVDAALSLAAQRDALVVIAVPLPSLDSVLRRIVVVAPNCPVTDVISVKGPVLDAVERLAPGLQFAGGHPMAGRSESGWAAGSAELFHGAAWVVTADEKTDLAAWRIAAELALDCGAHVVPTTAYEHDDAVARISHLPHVLAAVLAAVGADVGPLPLALAAGSFRDGTRVAGSRPELVRAMCEGNAPALLPALDDALGRLGAARGALASTGSLKATLDAGHRGRLALIGQQQSDWLGVTVDLTAPDVHDALQSIGAQGGHVVRLADNTAVAEIPRSRVDNDL
jgi:prephenate dehydrogenase